MMVVRSWYLKFVQKMTRNGYNIVICDICDIVTPVGMGNTLWVRKHTNKCSFNMHSMLIQGWTNVFKVDSNLIQAWTNVESSYSRLDHSWFIVDSHLIHTWLTLDSELWASVRYWLSSLKLKFVHSRTLHCICYPLCTESPFNPRMLLFPAHQVCSAPNQSPM